MSLFCLYSFNIVMEDEIIKKRVNVESEISTALQSLSMRKIKRCLSVLVVCHINVFHPRNCKK